MPVDKFGRNGDRATPVYTGINITNLTNAFLRRDEGNTAIGAIDLNSNIIKNVTDPVSNQDVAIKNYVDTNGFARAGGTVFGPILLNVSSNNQHSIKNVKNPVERFDAVTKAYVDRVINKSFTGIIPNTVSTDHTLVSFPDAKSFLSKKTIVGVMWVERLPGEMISTSSPMFATEWPGFHKFTRGPSLMTFFSGSPASGWTRNFRLDCIELP